MGCVGCGRCVTECPVNLDIREVIQKLSAEFNFMENPYIPFLMRIEDVILETEDRKIKTFVLAFISDKDRNHFAYIPGQPAEVSFL